MYVHFKVWPNTIEYFARAYVYYLDMDQNIAIKHTQHTQIFGRLARLWFVCVCVHVSVFELKTLVTRESTLYTYTYVYVYISNTITTTTHTFWNERCSCCYGFKLRKHACLYNKTNITSKPPPPSNRWWLISVQRIRMSDLVKVLSVLCVCLCICCFDADQWPFSKMNAT